MATERLPITPELELTPGVYYLTVDLPDSVLDFLAYRSGWMQDIAAYVLKHTERRIRFLGGGPAWTTIPGTNAQTRVLMMHFRVLEDEASSASSSTPQLAAIAAPVVVSLAVFLTALTVAIGVFVSLSKVQEILREIPDDAKDDLAGGFRDSARAFLVLSLAGGGLLAYWLAQRHGLIGGGK